MANKHSDVITRSILYDEDVKKIEETLGKPLASFSFDEIWGAYTKKHKLQETVSVGSAAIAAKVMTDVMEGGRFFGERWRKLVTVHNMTEEKEIVPIMTEKDYLVHRGPNRPPKQSGGEVATIELDVSKESKDRNMWVSFRKRDIEHKKFNMVSAGLKRAGAKFQKFILDEVTQFAIDNAGTTQALGGDDRFTAVTKLVAKLEDAGFMQGVAAVNPTDFAEMLTTTLGNNLPFITNTQIDRNGNIIRNLQTGEDYMLLGYIPGIKVPDYSSLNGNVIIEDPNCIQFGLYKDLAIEDWKDPFKSLEGFSITATYDIKTNSSKLGPGIGKGTGF